MADKRIQDLTPASQVQTSDRFVLEQSGQAKSLTGQILINDLAAALDGHGGISDISYTAPSSGSLTGTLTITLADETVETFNVTNGKGIASIDDKWAASSSNTIVPSTWYDSAKITTTLKYLWHYQIITFNDGTTLDTDKVVVGAYGDTGDADHMYIKWSDAYPAQDADMLNYPSNYIGVCTTTDDTAPTAYTDYEWFQYKGATGETGNGITSVTLDSSSGLVDTYKVLFDDNTYTTFNVTNGSDIDSITKTSSSGLTDTYTVLLTNGDATTFNVVNGKSITSITNVDVTHVAGHTDVYRINFNDGDTFSFSIYNGTNGSGSVSSVDNIPSSNQNVPLLILGSGAPTTTTVGLLKQRYFDQTNSNLYICTGIDTSGAETTYIWQGATSITVDSALSTLSTNPVQNAVLTALLGTTTLTTTAQTLTGAVNELDTKIGRTALPTTAQTLTGAIDELDADLSEKVSRSGDTMTGELRINDDNFVIKNNVADITAASISAQQNNWYRVYDKNGRTLANFDGTQETNGTTKARIYANNQGTGTAVSNALTLSVANDGTRTVNVTDPSPWRNALGIGTSGAFPITVAQGGTGATSASGARSELGLGSVATENTVPIGKGGTNATTAANARKNLELCYAANDTMTISSSMVLHGLITKTALTYMYFDVPVEKSMENISTITATTMTGWIAGVNGAINGTSSTTNYIGTGYTVSCTKQGNTHVRIGLVKSSAFTNATAYSPVTYFGTLTLKFT